MDKQILRDLAKKQLEYANSETNQNTIKEWYRHNACKDGRPLIHLESRTFEHELIPQRLKCQDERARAIERELYRNILNHELLGDDSPVLDYFPLSKKVWMTPFGLHTRVHHAKNSLGHEFEHYIHDLEEDFHKLGTAEIVNCPEETEAEKQFLEEIFVDILPVKIINNSLYSVPTQTLVHIMGMETMYMSIMDYPELFHKMMKMYTADTIKYYRFLENERLLETTNHSEVLIQGSWCFNNELGNPAHVKTTNMWGYLDSQETGAMSPAMYKEFIFPYYKEISDNFGLLSYGCCEPIHPIWDNCLSTLGNLRKASISPWCNEIFMGERLRGSKIIFHRKPSPNYLGVGSALDEEAFRKHIRQTLHAAKGCVLEITQRDVYTINHDENKAKRYIEIIRQEIENHW